MNAQRYGRCNSEMFSISCPLTPTLRTMLYREGQEPIGNVTDSAKASLDKIVAYAGYEWSIPGSGIHVTFIYPSGEAKTDRSQYEGGMESFAEIPDFDL